MKIKLSCALILTAMVMPGFAVDLSGVYQQAAANNGTYQAAVATYKAASYGVPIARANLLPSLTLAGNFSKNYQSTASPSQYNTSTYTLTLTQPLLALGSWYSLSQAEATYRQAAVTLAQAQQTLIMNTATAYFGVLEAQDQLKYAQANQESLAEQMRQVEAQYKVGLKALTDVQSTRASYESAVASTVSAENALDNAIQNLVAITGQPEKDIAVLEQNFPLIKPNPEQPEQWVTYGLKNNLALQSAQLQADINRLAIPAEITNTTNGYTPTINAEGLYTGTKNNSNTNGYEVTKTAELALNYSIINGGSTYATVKQDRYTYQSSQATVIQTQRTTASNVRQAYLNVLSDIGQVQAFQQAVISGEASLKAIRAGYLVGIRTIVDVLTAQSNLFSSQQQYAQAIYNYITDSLTLKEQAGNLSPQDLTAINTWLVPVSTVTAAPTPNTNAPAASAPTTSTQAPAPAIQPAMQITPPASNTTNN